LAIAVASLAPGSAVSDELNTSPPTLELACIETVLLIAAGVSGLIALS